MHWSRLSYNYHLLVFLWCNRWLQNSPWCPSWYMYSCPVSSLTSQTTDLPTFPLSGCIVLACLPLLPSCCRWFFFSPSHWAAEAVPQWKFKHPQVSSQFLLCFLRVNRQFLFLQDLKKIFMEWVWSALTLQKLQFSRFWNENFAISKVFSNNKCIVVFFCLGDASHVWNDFMRSNKIQALSLKF